LLLLLLEGDGEHFPALGRDLGKGHVDGFPHEHLVVHLLDGGRGFFGRGVADEAEAFRGARVLREGERERGREGGRGRREKDDLGWSLASKRGKGIGSKKGREGGRERGREGEREATHRITHDTRGGNGAEFAEVRAQPFVVERLVQIFDVEVAPLR
jgi:hypothetical protein